jgi:hypothetical protein
MTQPTIGYAQESKLRSLVVATNISLLCVSAFAIYLWSAKEPLEVILLLLAAPFILHAISLALLLQRPGAGAVTTSMVIGSLGLLASCLFLPIAVLDWAMSNTPITPLLILTYLSSQAWVLFQGVRWKKGAVEAQGHR